MKQALAVVAFAMLATKAVALDMAAIEACTEIEADKARLACFDIAVVAQAPQNDEADTTAPDVLSIAGGYVPTKRWEFDAQGDLGYAWAATDDGQNSFVLGCGKGGVAIWSELNLGPGWQANVPAFIQIDSTVFDTHINGGSGFVGFVIPPADLGITDEFIGALTQGSYLAVTGPATEAMQAGDKVFSLSGSAAAIGSLRRHCGL